MFAPSQSQSPIKPRLARNNATPLNCSSTYEICGLAHPLRLAIVDFLNAGPQCVCDIAQHVNAQRSNVSRHLAIMLKAGILECQKQGLKVIYTLKTPCITSFLTCVNQVVRNQADQTNAVLQLIDQSCSTPTVVPANPAPDPE